NSGAVILTNAFIPQYYYNYAETVDMADGAPNAGAEGGAPGSSDPVRVRRNFPETWLWQMLQTGEKGEQIIQETVPDTITSWIITGFSLDPSYGFGLLESPAK
ncbi:hypothetical protein L9F63_018161, partial [Diploptera punctata]